MCHSVVQILPITLETFPYLIAGIRVCAAVVAGEGEGAAEDLSQSVADGELDTPQDEPQLISHDE